VKCREVLSWGIRTSDG